MRGQRRRASCERPPREWRILPRRFTKIVPFTANASGLGASFGHCSTMTTPPSRRDARGWQEVPSPELSRRSLHRLRRAGRVASVAEFERERLRERTLLGLDRAKAQGTTLGARR